MSGLLLGGLWAVSAAFFGAAVVLLALLTVGGGK